MKKKPRTRTASGVIEMRGRIEKQIEGMAQRAKVHVKRKGDWVAGKVVQAMDKIEQAVDKTHLK